MARVVNNQQEKHRQVKQAAKSRDDTRQRAASSDSKEKLRVEIRHRALHWVARL